MSLRRNRRAKIVATLGPASSDRDTLRSLFHAGVDVFRLNFSHGSAEDHAVRMAILREIEAETGRPIGVMADLQGPAARGRLRAGAGAIAARPALPPGPGPAPRQRRARLPAPPEIFAALAPGAELLLDDGRLRLRVDACDATSADTRVLVGGRLSERKGVNVPGVVLPISALTPRTCATWTRAALGADWIALSFVQRPEDIIEARERIGDRARIIAKLEKPSAVERLDEIIAQADALMVARGDLGVELPAEQVPAIQKRAVRGCRRAGKPVIVATQMLESMIESPVPTRAEASDVATAIYDGADAVMLSAESATGKHPQAAVAMMSRIIEGTEADPQYRQLIDASHSPPCRASRTRPRPCAARCATPPRCSRRPRSSASPVPAPPACARRANGRRRRCSASRPAWRRAADAGVGRAFRACGRRGRHRAVHPPGLRRGDAGALLQRRTDAGDHRRHAFRQGRHHQSAAHRHRLKNQI